MPKPRTIGESLYWSYANLAMMEGVLTDGAGRLGRRHYAIRSRLYSGLCNDTMSVRGFFDDEKMKLRLPKACWYCGSPENLSADHIVPQAQRGKDGGENLVYACRSCNSSKGSKDMLIWMASKGRFPPLYLLRRYLKMAIEYCREHNLMDVPLAEVARLGHELPFALDHIPHRYPPARLLCKWVGGTEQKACDKEGTGE